MKNIHIVPTDKPSRLACDFDKLILNSRLLSPILYKTQNIYITSDEEIKEGDWFLHPFNTIHKAGGNLIDKDFKKIILTTDELYIHNDLIPKEYNPFPQYIQKIDDDFLEWFVKNPSCEEVEVQKGKMKLNDDGQEYGFPDMSLYKIIIPSEEPKQELERGITITHVGKPKQETLENKLKSLVEEWRKRQEHYIDIADRNLDHEHTYKKFTYKAMATRDCWKELLKLIEDEK